MNINIYVAVSFLCPMLHVDKDMPHVDKDMPPTEFRNYNSSKKYLNSTNIFNKYICESEKQYEMFLNL